MPSKKAWFWVLALAIVVGVLGYFVYDGSVTLPRSVREAMTGGTTPAAQTARTNAAKSANKLVFPVGYPGNPKPEYPESAMRRHEEGSVLLHIHVDREGRVQDAKLLRSSGSTQLDRSALATVQQRWRYVPGKQNGKPVPMWQKVKVTFTCQSDRRDICDESY